jgi:hypothetical protein
MLASWTTLRQPAVLLLCFGVALRPMELAIWLQSFSSVKIQIFLFCNDFRHVFDITIMQK